MVRRVWTGSFEGPEAINIGIKEFARIEAICGHIFRMDQKARIQLVLDDYYLWQSWEWSCPRPKIIQDKLSALESITTKWLETWKGLHDDASEQAQLIADIIETEFYLKSRTAPNYPTQTDSNEQDVSVGIKTRLSFQIWLGETVGRVEAMLQLAKSASASLPTDRGGRDDAKGQFRLLVLGLAEIFKETGGETTVTFDPSTEGYRNEGFLALVHAVQSILPEKFRYIGLSLGKVVQSIIADASDPNSQSPSHGDTTT